MEKNPKTCGNSFDMKGIPICMIAQLPCVRVRKCALETLKEASDVIADFIKTEQVSKKDFKTYELRRKH